LFEDLHKGLKENSIQDEHQNKKVYCQDKKPYWLNIKHISPSIEKIKKQGKITTGFKILSRGFYEGKPAHRIFDLILKTFPPILLK